MSQLSCSTCVFRKPDERPEYDGAGHCRRYPPQIAVWTVTHPEGGQSQPGFEQHYPWMHADDWCGEWASGAEPNGRFRL